MRQFLRLYIASYEGLSAPTWMLALVLLINRSGAMVLPFLGVYMTSQLHFTLFESGMVLSFFGLGAVSGAWLGGWLTDRYGPFWIQTASLFFSAPFFFILPLLDTVGTLSLGMFVLSLVADTFRPANSVSVSQYAKRENITKAFSLNRMAINLGFSIGPAAGGLLAGISYDLLFYVNGMTCIIAGLTFYLYFRRKKNTNPAKHSTSVGAPVSPYRDVPFLFFSLLCALFAVCFFQLLTTLPLFYRVDRLMDEKAIGLILAFSGLVVFSLEMLVVHVAERNTTVSKAIVLGILLCGTSFFMLTLSGSMTMLYTSMFMLCIGEILAMPFTASVTAQRSVGGSHGAYMGLHSLSYSLAHIISPTLGTKIADVWGFGALWWGTAITCILVAIGMHQVMKRMARPAS